MSCRKTDENCLKAASLSAKLLYFYGASNILYVAMKEEVQDISNKRLELIRRLIDLAYTYSDKELFYQKFIETVHITSLKDSEVVNIGDHALQLPCENELSDDEVEMYCLMQQGFTPQEIAVIYKEKSVNAVYIKRHRLKKKLKGAASPEVVLVMLIQCVIAYAVGRLAGWF